VGSETLPSVCYILSVESSIPFYSTSNGYKNKKERYSREPRLSDTRYAAKGIKGKMEIYNQQSEIVVRQLFAFATNGYLGGR